MNSQDFRAIAPYIHSHRGKRVVIMLPGEAIGASDSLIADIALLHSLGLKIVLVHGYRPQLDAMMAQNGLQPSFHDGRRITPADAQPQVLAAAGATRLQLEAALSQGLPNTPMAHAKIRVVGGNMIQARPLGVIDGVDMQHTGTVRAIDARAIERHLDVQDMVLISCLGHSLTGEIFNLRLHEVAQRTATAIQADKLIILGKHWPAEFAGGLLREIAAGELLTQLPNREGQHEILGLAAETCQQGVERVHLLNWRQDGVLLDELFTRDGVGTLIFKTAYERMRQAVATDIGNLVDLLKPMEEAGYLVKRERERLENEVDNFYVIERDSSLIGCAALYPLSSDSAEIACVAVHPDYQGGDLGDNLLRHLERQARSQGLKQLAVLTTVAEHWFQEQGFTPAQVSDLPDSRQALYNYQRASKVLIKHL